MPLEQREYERFEEYGRIEAYMGVYVNESGTLGDSANVRGILAEWSIGTGKLALVLNQLL